MDRELKIFIAKNTQDASWKPTDGKRIVLTSLKIRNGEERPVCIRLDIGERTRFVAYLDRQKKPISEIDIRLPVPLTGDKDEPVTIQTFEKLPVSVCLAGYEV